MLESLGLRTTHQTSANLPIEWLDDLVRYAFARLGHREEAEDAASETWHEATRRPHRVLQADNPRAFLIAMARRRIVDRQRRLKKRKTETWAEGATDDRSDLHRVMVDQVLASLSDDHREVLVLKYVHGFSQEEIAAITGRTTAATNSLLQRARESFRDKGAHLVQDEENSL